jgi:two-component system, OmpR family, KDP operon response regulator KdpE
MGKAASTVLVVDSDPAIGRVISDGLDPYGYLVSIAETGGAGLSAAVHMMPDVILLDPDLSDMSGIEFLNMIRSWSAVPIIILSCETDENKKVQFLRSGAADYVTKPFGVAELAARCDAVGRRTASATAGDPVVRTGPPTIDLKSRAAILNGRQLTGHAERRGSAPHATRLQRRPTLHRAH